nr:hypothetical protein [Couchioplanes caeruleus]
MLQLRRRHRVVAGRPGTPRRRDHVREEPRGSGLRSIRASSRCVHQRGDVILHAVPEPGRPRAAARPAAAAARDGGRHRTARDHDHRHRHHRGRRDGR